MKLSLWVFVQPHHGAYFHQEQRRQAAGVGAVQKMLWSKTDADKERVDAGKAKVDGNKAKADADKEKVDAEKVKEDFEKAKVEATVQEVIKVAVDEAVNATKLKKI